MAYSRKQPLLVLMERDLRTEGLLDTGFDWWVQSCPLDPSSMQTTEFTGVFAAWKDRVEQFQSTPITEPAQEDPPKLEKLTVGQLLRLLELKQLWAGVLVVLAILGSSFKAGHSLGPIFLGDPKSAPSAQTTTYDQPATLTALRALAEKSPPYQGTTEDGNVRPQMEAFISAFEVSNHPKLLRAVIQLLGEVEARENPDKPKEFFDANNEFRAELDTFLSRVRIYSETGNWDP